MSSAGGSPEQGHEPGERRDAPAFGGLPTLGTRRTTSETIAEVLRQAIVRGTFSAGAELSQVALARYFGVSRAPIREALRQLQAEGLVTARAHMRAVVNGIPVDAIVEIFELRTLLEGSLVERSLPRFDAAGLERLESLCAAMDTASTHDVWLAGNRAFHEALHVPSGASLTLEMIRRLSTQVERYVRAWSPARPERRREANEEHRRIVGALIQGDGRRARLELELHIQRSSELTLQAFRRSRLPDRAAPPVLAELADVVDIADGRSGSRP